jgi:membrane protein DedA with SNARE-associated domain
VTAASTLTALIAIVGATFVSEDLTTVSVGLGIRDGLLPPLPALIACALGILIGDVGLWAIGRVAGRRVLTWPAMRRLPLDSVRALAAWADRHPAAAMLWSRCLPGTRVPLYLAAGIWGERPWRLLAWMGVAVSLWTPLLLIATMTLGTAIAAPLHGWFGSSWAARAIAGAVMLVVLRIAASCASVDGRRRLAIRLARARRWEFWPAWIVNAPVAVWIAILSIRYRSLTLFTAANPGIADGGFVGESKSAILASLPPEWVMPWVAIEAGHIQADRPEVDHSEVAPTETRLAQLRATMIARSWRFPLVFKPDQGERGTGVRWIADERAARRYLAAEPRTVIAQVPHDGPFEAGLFYVRHPDDARGRLFSVTDKHFPIVTGDGRSTLAELIHRHARFRLQASVFLARHADRIDRVPVEGESVRLAQAGNHAQGTEFLDGRHLITPALEARIDEIARRIDGFYFGRFDVRYHDRQAFMEGRDLAIIELNGVSSEATHIYDPSRSLRGAWATLMEQWSLAFAIGAANRARGHRPTSIRRLASLIWTHLRATTPHRIAD